MYTIQQSRTLPTTAASNFILTIRKESLREILTDQSKTISPATDILRSRWRNMQMILPGSFGLTPRQDRDEPFQLRWCLDALDLTGICNGCLTRKNKPGLTRGSWKHWCFGFQGETPRCYLFLRVQFRCRLQSSDMSGGSKSD